MRDETGWDDDTRMEGEVGLGIQGRIGLIGLVRLELHVVSGGDGTSRKVVGSGPRLGCA